MVKARPRVRYSKRPYADDKTVTAKAFAELLSSTDLCFYCGLPAINKHVDHMVPISRGGPHSMVNLVVACRPCNLAKKAKSFDRWVEEVPSRRRAAVLREYRSRFGDERQSVLL
jgi:5-methylcytosine-specific restriction endonuclease McrA